MFNLNTISDDEIDYFNSLKDKENNTELLNYISKFDDENISQNIKYPVNKNHKITANIATHPVRYDSLLRTLKTIDGQFDEIRIYLNNFDFVPDELNKYTTYIGRDLTDNGKFFWCQNNNEYYFTIDDDIIYPPDYVEKTLPLIGNRIISYHGKILVGKNRGYYDKHKAYMYYFGLRKERKLDVMGTGVSAFDTNFFSPNLWKTPNYKMTDLVISLEAHMCKVPIICPVRKKNWLTFEELSLDSIWYNMLKHDDKLSIWADMISTLVESNIDISQLNYCYKEESINKICDFVFLNNLQDFTFVNMRIGNGTLVNSILENVNFKVIYACDTDPKRVEGCNKFYSKNHIQFKYCELYSDLDLKNKDCFVFFDDLKISYKVSTEVYQNLKPGSHLICHNLVNGVFPDESLSLEIDTGEEFTFYYYLKK
jgi:hypothetical protein